ncbi:ParB N-terminal domain-containing protein [Nostoc sp.]|uniref:ParB N-terminal domain-containing protein n=1 Tax=Nostoc sp. TaxID=1180 RepID=UPI002FF949CB
MLLSVSFVPVKQITSSVPRSNFSDSDLNRIAELILKGEGIINPLILRSTSLESYEVVDGHFEYYAAARAREIDLRKGEMIGAFVIESNNQEALEQQVKFLRTQNVAISSHVAAGSDITESRLMNIESRMTNQESRSEKRTNELEEEWKREIKNIYNRLNELENRLPKPIEPLEALNNWNLTKLTSKLSRVNVKSQIIEKLFNEREANGKYSSFSNIVDRIKGLGDKTMLKIIDSFAEGTV